MFNNFSEKTYRLWNDEEKYGTARHATEDNIIWCMRTAFLIPKATNTHSEFIVIFLFHGNNGYANAFQRYVYTYTACSVRFTDVRKQPNST
jgi:hypothetical protein